MGWVVVAVLGALVGVADIIGRYRDAPWRSLLNWSAALYLGINIAASLFALVLIHAFGWDFGLSGDAAEWMQVLVAGVGAVSFLRSSFYSVRIGDEDVQVGPGNLLKVILDAADRDVDRARAAERALTVNRIMRNVSFTKAQQALPAFCFALVQNLSPEDQQASAAELAALANASMPDEVRARLLGLALINVVGEGVLLEAVSALGDEIRTTPQTAAASAIQPPDADIEVGGIGHPQQVGDHQ